MKILAALSLCLLTVLAPYTAVLTLASGLPWQTFKESIPNVVNANRGSCGSEEILVATLEKDGRLFVYFAAESGRYLFAEMDGDMPTMIFIGQQLPAPNQDTIKIIDSHPFSEARDGAGPCGHLFPKTA